MKKVDEESRPLLAVSMGDPSGIGPEITVKALCHREITQMARLVIVGDPHVLDWAIQGCHAPMKISVIDSVSQAVDAYGTVNVIPVSNFSGEQFEYGKVAAAYGDAAFRYVNKAIDLALNHEVMGVVTAPVNKEAMHLAGHLYSGHTEIFAERTHSSQYAMVLCSQSLRVIHVSTHVSMLEACRRVKRERVAQVIGLADDAMKELGIQTPRIAVAGLNAHASENGLFGQEEKQEIIPAVQEMQAKGLLVEGPVPPDTVFVKGVSGQYDIIVAMYHDQGHIPLKLSGFHIDPATGRFDACHGVNFTAGLPIIRTSVDHGTAFDKAGKFVSNEESMVEAIEIAVKMAKNRAVRDFAKPAG